MVVKARRSFTESPVAESERSEHAIEAIRSLDRAAAKGILHPNNAARRKSRLMRQLVKLGGTTQRPAPAAAPAKGGKKGAAQAQAAAPAKGDKKTRK